MRKYLGSLLVSLTFVLSTNAQVLQNLNICIISETGDKNGDISSFEKKVKDEINVLMTNRKNVIYSTKESGNSSSEIANAFESAFDDVQVDIVLAIGALPSAVLAQRSSFSKPAIAGIIIDNELQNVPLTADGSSGVNNFTYVQSPFSFDNDLKILHEIYPFKNVGVISTSNLNDLFPKFEDLFRNSATNLNTKFTKVEVSTNVTESLNSIPADVDAIYVFPLYTEFGNAEYEAFFQGIADKQLPSVGLLGETMTDQGAMVGYESASNLAKMPRRIALNVSKIAAGKNASELPVLIKTFSETLIINMSTVRKVGTYPNWDMMTEAVLINENAIESDVKLSLQSAIMEALSNNLTLKYAKKNPLIAEKDVDLARSELRPQLDVNTSLVLLDENTSGNSFATKGRLNWMAGSSLSQLVYAEPALANVAIQKLLQKGEEYGVEVAQLDVVIDAATSYLSVLQAQSFLKIQAANVSVTKNNLDIAKAKDAVGYSGATDLNRWKSELALNKIDLNDAQVQFRQAKYGLNQLLDRPIKENFEAEDVSVVNNLLFVTDERMINRIQNEKELEQIADFFVEEAMSRLPELKQIHSGLAAQERLLVSQKRAFYLPSFAFSGGLDHTLKRWDVDLGQLPALPDLKPAWNLGVGAQYPILQGGARRSNQEKTELSILQIKDQQANTRNQLELRIRAALQTAGASFFRVERYQEANKAASDNFIIVQDSYTQGLTSVTNLIDAQNAKVQTDLGLANANYQFILDFMELERSIGFYYQLSSAGEQTSFFDRMETFLLKE